MHDDPTIPMTSPPSPAPAAEEVNVPRQLGSVKLLREIGRGGMGVVWLGRDELLDREVAVKFLFHAQAAPDDPGFAGFLEGARAAAAVRHLGLTAVHQADLAAGVPYLVMEYIDGPTLADVLRQAGALSAPATLAALQSICDAIGELHERGVLHRDIKPSNILLDAQGQTFVTDFGLSCARPILRAAGLSEARVAGTPQYMAPEVFDGLASPRGDVYALGVAAFQLLTGQAPFSGTLDEIREKHRNAPLPVELLQQRGVDAALIEVLERATHKDAMFRHKTARHLLRALRDAVPDDEIWTKGAAELTALAARCHAASGDAAQQSEGSPSRARAGAGGAKTPAAQAFSETSEPPSSASSAYYEHLAAKAAHKRQEPVDPVTARPAAGEEIKPAYAPPHRAIQVDLPCVACGYNLRTLSAESRCPECGGAVAVSLKRDRLLFADPRWLVRVRRGLQGFYWAIAGLLLAVPVLMVLPLLMRVFNAASFWMGFVAVLVSVVVGVASIFLITAREKNGPPIRRRAVLRWVVRGAVFCWLFSWMFGIANQKPLGGETARTFWLLLSSITGLAFINGFLGYLAQIAQRAAKRSLVTATYSLAALWTVLILVSLPATRNGRPNELTGTAVVICCLGLMIGFLSLLGSYQRLLRKARQESVVYESVLDVER